jgi:hypothetical protein
MPFPSRPAAIVRLRPAFLTAVIVGLVAACAGAGLRGAPDPIADTLRDATGR